MKSGKLVGVDPSRGSHFPPPYLKPNSNRSSPIRRDVPPLTLVIGILRAAGPMATSSPFSVGGQGASVSIFSVHLSPPSPLLVTLAPRPLFSSSMI
ncbi:hypothetical protein VTN49DRAFT_4614 [Thermomyces lanuginosus]|uniref:uncharacterized protein n=1 Tax=Thermomyces lanuginosus TaxID=5541 RepID=UPI003743C03B